MRNSITALRISLGAVFLGFGVLKYFPGVSPAGSVTVSTISILTFGLVPDTVALVGTATLECLIGLSLLAGRGLRVTVYLLAVELLGILSPLVLLTGRLFSGPHQRGQCSLPDLPYDDAALELPSSAKLLSCIATSTTPPTSRAPTTRSTSWPKRATARSSAPWSGWRRSWRSTCRGTCRTRSSGRTCHRTAAIGQTARSGGDRDGLRLV